MSDEVDLLKQVDGVLTKVTIKYPDSWELLWRAHKQIKHILDFPEEHKATPGKTLLKVRTWLTAAMVNHPMFDEDFRPMVNEITDYFGDQRRI